MKKSIHFYAGTETLIDKPVNFPNTLSYFKEGQYNHILLLSNFILSQIKRNRKLKTIHRFSSLTSHAKVIKEGSDYVIQRFIELGKGYSDIYELLELAENMPDRIEHYLAIHSVGKTKTVTSLAIIMKKTKQGEFQPIYICLEGLPDSTEVQSKRYQSFETTALKQGHKVIDLTVKSSEAFHEKELFYQYVTGILRMNRLLQPYS